MPWIKNVTETIQEAYDANKMDEKVQTNENFKANVSENDAKYLTQRDAWEYCNKKKKGSGKKTKSKSKGN